MIMTKLLLLPVLVASWSIDPKESDSKSLTPTHDGVPSIGLAPKEHQAFVPDSGTQAEPDALQTNADEMVNTDEEKTVRSAYWHVHYPHGHLPHGHRPHRHRPHGHSPHSHRPTKVNLAAKTMACEAQEYTNAAKAESEVKAEETNSEDLTTALVSPRSEDEVVGDSTSGALVVAQSDPAGDSSEPVHHVDLDKLMKDGQVHLDEEEEDGHEHESEALGSCKYTSRTSLVLKSGSSLEYDWSSTGFSVDEAKAILKLAIKQKFTANCPHKKSKEFKKARKVKVYSSGSTSAVIKMGYSFKFESGLKGWAEIELPFTVTIGYPTSLSSAQVHTPKFRWDVGYEVKPKFHAYLSFVAKMAEIVSLGLKFQASNPGNALKLYANGGLSGKAVTFSIIVEGGIKFPSFSIPSADLCADPITFNINEILGLPGIGAAKNIYSHTINLGQASQVMLYNRMVKARGLHNATDGEFPDDEAEVLEFYKESRHLPPNATELPDPYEKLDPEINEHELKMQAEKLAARSAAAALSE